MNTVNRDNELRMNTNNDDEIDLKEIINVLWTNKKLIIVISFCFAISSLAYSLSLTNYYKSEAVLIIAGESDRASALSGLGGLASMAGINLQSGGQDKSTLVIETIKSRAFLKHLLQFNNILPSIMATKSYDQKSKKILYDAKLYDKDLEKWVRIPPPNQKSKPSHLEAYNQYLKQISITKDLKTPLIFLSMEHISPTFAKEFLDLVIKEANELLRQKDLQESSSAIKFLTSEIPKSSLITMKDAINQLVESKLEMQMMAKINPDYILRVIEPPFSPIKKSKPGRAVICISGAILGGILAVLWVLMSSYLLGSHRKKILDS